jgi:hypothetical protein
VIAAYDNTGEVIAVACADTQIIMLFSTSAIDSVSPACLAGSHLLDPPCAQAEYVQGPFFHGRLDDPVLATISQPPPKPVFTSIGFSNNGHYILLGTSSDVHYVLDAYSEESVVIVRRLVGHRGFEYDRYGNKDVAPRRGAGGEEVGWTPNGSCPARRTGVSSRGTCLRLRDRRSSCPRPTTLCARRRRYAPQIPLGGRRARLGQIPATPCWRSEGTTW